MQKQKFQQGEISVEQNATADFSGVVVKAVYGEDDSVKVSEFNISEVDTAVAGDVGITFTVEDNNGLAQ